MTTHPAMEEHTDDDDEQICDDAKLKPAHADAVPNAIGTLDTSAVWMDTNQYPHIVEQILLYEPCWKVARQVSAFYRRVATLRVHEHLVVRSQPAASAAFSSGQRPAHCRMHCRWDNIGCNPGSCVNSEPARVDVKHRSAGTLRSLMHEHKDCPSHGDSRLKPLLNHTRIADFPFSTDPCTVFSLQNHAPDLELVRLFWSPQPTIPRWYCDDHVSELSGHVLVLFPFDIDQTLRVGHNPPPFPHIWDSVLVNAKKIVSNVHYREADGPILNPIKTKVLWSLDGPWASTYVYYFNPHFESADWQEGPSDQWILRGNAYSRWQAMIDELRDIITDEHQGPPRTREVVIVNLPTTGYSDWSSTASPAMPASPVTESWDRDWSPPPATPRMHSTPLGRLAAHPEPAAFRKLLEDAVAEQAELRHYDCPFSLEFLTEDEYVARVGRRVFEDETVP